MKINRLLNIFTLSSLATFSACDVEEASNENVTTTLYADIEREGATKTYLSGPDSGFYGTLWSKGDEIGVYSGSSTADPFTLTDGADSKSGKFAGTTRTGDKTAVYPYSICGKLNESTISVTLPEKQTYRSGNISSGAYPMVATGDGSNLRFKNLCSVLKISITGNVTVNSIVFSANDESVKSSGEATITVDAQNPKLVMSANANGSVELFCPSVVLSDSPTDFYIVVPSQEYSSGFSLAIDTDKGGMLKTTDNDITLKRSELYRINLSCRNEAADKKVFFEDNSFKAYLLATYDKNNDGEISYEEAESIREISICTDTIASIAGIENMPNLEKLYCYGSQDWDEVKLDYRHNGILKKLDISQNTKLRYLNCLGNQLKSLNTRENKELIGVNCSYNGISGHLDLSENPVLKYAYAKNNQLTSIDLSNNIMLIELSVDNNLLTALDINQNTSLQSLSCPGNKLVTLNLNENRDIKSLTCNNNALKTIDINSCKSIAYLNCDDNKIESLNLRNNTRLERLYCKGNKISSLDIKYLSKLTMLGCGLNPITSLNLRLCKKLTQLSVNATQITALDISTIDNLEHLFCYKTPLKSLYVREGQYDAIRIKVIPSEAKVIIGSMPDEDEVFSVSPELFDIGGEEQEITLKVTSSVAYSLNGTSDWISKKSENNGVFTFKVEANSASSPRTGEIRFVYSNNAVMCIEVKQGIQSIYSSSDYSRNGEATLLHKATVGKGIDIVFVGEAFTDRDQELFDSYTELGEEAFFTEEPFKSTKDRFNVYRVNAVSKNGIMRQDGGDTKFSVEFGNGTYVEGDNDDVFNFVGEALPSVNLTKAIIIVIINKFKYAGTCWMYNNGSAIGYVPLSTSKTEFAQTLRHEGCGHGFGKLADEYYSGNKSITQDEINYYNNEMHTFGFFENIDFTSDPEKILWSEFIFDERYSGKVGVFEGGDSYAKGVYRPTENSIMRYNTGGFNAPSRESIYKKIMKISEGDNWIYDRQTFVEFDAPARRAEAATRIAAQAVGIDKNNFVPLAPPVMVMVGK